MERTCHVVTAITHHTMQQAVKCSVVLPISGIRATLLAELTAEDSWHLVIYKHILVYIFIYSQIRQKRSVIRSINILGSSVGSLCKDLEFFKCKTEQSLKKSYRKAMYVNYQNGFCLVF